MTTSQTSLSLRQAHPAYWGLALGVLGWVLASWSFWQSNTSDGSEGSELSNPWEFLTGLTFAGLGTVAIVLCAAALLLRRRSEGTSQGVAWLGILSGAMPLILIATFTAVERFG